jgi:exopolysaccharide production protein ExoQ
MPPIVASILVSGLILFLYYSDRNHQEFYSKALFIPLIWILTPKIEPIFRWLGIESIISAGSHFSVTEGNPLFRNIYLVLIIFGLIILKKRQINWQQLIVKNYSVWLFFAFGLISLFWSDYPFVAFKRLVKAFGTFIMVLVIITGRRPYESIGVIIKYLSYIFLPLSFLFIKYYPSIGRSYHYDGTMMFTGIADQKNGLGQICLMAGIYFSWKLLLGNRARNSFNTQLNYFTYLIVFSMLGWLLYKSNSATSLACLIIAISVFAIARHPLFLKNYRTIIPLGIAFIFFFIFLDYTFNLKDNIIVLFGRRPDLTTRVPMWQDLISMVDRPLIGFGYESFWLGDRREYMISRWAVDDQAHNGYLEMYLQLGIIGVLFVFWWILSGLKNINNHLSIDYSIGIFRLCLLVVVTLYNYTEATFFGTNTFWILFFIAIFYNPTIFNVSQEGGQQHLHPKDAETAL